MSEDKIDLIPSGKSSQRAQFLQDYLQKPLKQYTETEQETFKKRVQSNYSKAVSNWYSLMQVNNASPFFIIGSAATHPESMRLGIAPIGQTYKNAEMNHIIAATDEDGDYMPPSDIDILIPNKEIVPQAEAIAKEIFGEYGILLHIHSEVLKPNKPHKQITEELVNQGYPFPLEKK